MKKYIVVVAIALFALVLPKNKALAFVFPKTLTASPMQQATVVALIKQNILNNPNITTPAPVKNVPTIAPSQTTNNSNSQKLTPTAPTILSQTVVNLVKQNLFKHTQGKGPVIVTPTTPVTPPKTATSTLPTKPKTTTTTPKVVTTTPVTATTTPIQTPIVPASKTYSWDGTTVFDGYGTVAWDTGFKQLNMSPQVSTQSSETHAALAVSQTSVHQPFKLSYTMKTNKQLRTGSDPNDWEVGWTVFGYKNDGKFKYLILKPSAYGVEMGESLLNDKQNFLYTSALSQDKFPINNDYKVDLSAQNNIITINVNGKQYVQYDVSNKDILSTDGRYGFYTEDASIQVSNIKIEQL